MSNTLKLGNGKWATGKDTLLSFSDTNNNYKPLPFSFSRDSSGTVINKDGLIETVGTGEPRIDFKDNTKGALLLEPSRSNLFTYSEEFSNASVWGKVNTTFTDNETTSPSGLLTGKLTRNVTTFSCIRDTTISTTLGSTYVFSAFYKKDTETTINHSVLNENTGYVTFNFDTETISITRNDNGNTIETDGFGFDKYENGWYRIYLKFVRKGGSLQLQVARQDSGVIGQSTFIYAAQLEQGSYATSYIPTSGSAVTRVADACGNGGNEQVINSTEGVLYAEENLLSTLGSKRTISLSDGTLNNYCQIQFQGVSRNIKMIYTTIESGASVNTSYLMPNNINSNKIAFLWSVNKFQLWVNGIKVLEDLSAATSTSNVFSEIKFSLANGADIFYGKVKDVRVYNTALTDSELQALTTI